LHLIRGGSLASGKLIEKVLISRLFHWLSYWGR